MIIPRPLIHHDEDDAFEFGRDLTVYLAVGDDATSAHFVADELAQRLRVATGGFVSIKTGEDGLAPKGAVVLTDHQAPDDLGHEGYELIIKPERITLRAAAGPGMFYAGQSLMQLLHHHHQAPARDTAGAQSDGRLRRIPCAYIKDRPRFPWRGFMLDSARHFQPIEQVMRLIDRLGALKLNRLHWHLTEDQGWRLEVLAYPKLTGVGAWRSNGNGKGRYGGYYTQEQVREVVAYARQRHIIVVPEIEMPGHNLAALAAYPELSCTGGPFEVADQWGILDGVYCAGKPQTFTFLNNILNEVAEMFPGPYLHIGGDERKPGLWDNCPRCRGVRQEHGLADEAALQKWFMEKIAGHVHHGLGRRSIAWGDNIEAGASAGQIVHGWLPDQSTKAARLGMDTINSTHLWVHLDYPQSEKERARSKPDWMTVLPLEKVYGFDPIPADLEPDLHKHVLGSEASLWTEHVLSEQDMHDQLAPRLLAFAEAVWSPLDQRDFEDFKQRLAVLKPLLLPGPGRDG